MTLTEIKDAVDKNIEVYFKSINRVVTRSGDEYFIMCLDGSSNTIGLTWNNGITINGEEEDFFMVDGTENIVELLVQNDIKIIMENGKNEDYEFLNAVLTGEGFTQYSKMTASELHIEYMEMRINKREDMM